jgi:hypothetical protein
MFHSRQAPRKNNSILLLNFVVINQMGLYAKPIKSVKFGVFTAVIMNNGVFWDVTPCGCCKNRRFGGT